MRSRWDALHAGLTLSIRSEKSKRSFAKLKESQPTELAAFADPVALVETFNRRGGGVAALVEKNVLFGALVQCADLGSAGHLAIELLLLGLWPGLSALFSRLAYLYRQRPQDLAAEIVGVFTECARRLAVERCSRIAATLILNTERVIKTARLGELRRGATFGSFLAPGSEALIDPTGGHATSLVELRAWLTSAVPRDVDLILAVLVGDLNLHEAADAIGISHANARQRLTRAYARIRVLLDESGVTDGPTGPAFVRR